MAWTKDLCMMYFLPSKSGSVDAWMFEDKCDCFCILHVSTLVIFHLFLRPILSFNPSGSRQYCFARDVPCTPEALRLHRNTLTMELLWLQQAIDSRKKVQRRKGERCSVSLLLFSSDSLLLEQNCLCCRLNLFSNL